ncbi:MAG: helix-turn-helix domain-containing protein [Acidobacteria bacterium]|nr:helix-turn-helix domain-containing protein [Acidobacteriota bacterium]
MQRYIHKNNVSTIICNGLPHICDVAYDKEIVVNMQRESLADYVRRLRVKEKKLSLTDVERNSGGGIDASYVNRIENGIVTNVTPEKLSALAKGLQVSEDEIFAVARGKSLNGAEVFDSEIAVLFNGFDELSDEDKLELLATVKMLANEVQRRRPRNGKPKK